MKRKQQTIPSKFALDFASDVAISICPHIIRLLAKRLRSRRCVIEFSPYQGVKITTSDCYAGISGTVSGKIGHILVVRNSKWLRELREQLTKTDPTADFMDRAHHFAIFTQDGVIEIAAWGWEVRNWPRSRLRQFQAVSRDQR